MSELIFVCHNMEDYIMFETILVAVLCVVVAAGCVCGWLIDNRGSLGKKNEDENISEKNKE